MAFMVVSFHWRTSLAAGCANARLNRQAIIPRVATARPKARMPRFMDNPPSATGGSHQRATDRDGPHHVSRVKAASSRVSGFPFARRVDYRLEGRPVREQRGLHGGIQLLVEAGIVERHLVLPHRAHDALDLARGMDGCLHEDEPLHPRIVVGGVASVAAAF